MKALKNSGIYAENLTTQELLLFQRGDEPTFQRIHEQLRRDLQNFVRRWIPNPETVEELIQETFIRSFRARETYDPRYPLKTWMKAIARNAVSDWLRAQRSARQHLEPTPGDVATIPCLKPTAEVLLTRQVERNELRRFFRNLTHLQRRVLWLRALHGLSYQEIADRLNLTLPSVKGLVHRAKHSLSRLWSRPRE